MRQSIHSNFFGNSEVGIRPLLSKDTKKRSVIAFGNQRIATVLFIQKHPKMKFWMLSPFLKCFKLLDFKGSDTSHTVPPYD
jgi:hypothetical protein